MVYTACCVYFGKVFCELVKIRDIHWRTVSLASLKKKIGDMIIGSCANVIVPIEKK